MPGWAFGEATWFAGSDTDRMRATVLETGRDGPTRVRFQFNSSLDDPSFAWLAWKQGALHRIAVPRPDESVDLRAGDDL